MQIDTDKPQKIFLRIRLLSKYVKKKNIYLLNKNFECKFDLLKLEYKTF